MHLKQNKVKDQYKTGKFPIVLPVLLYHGKGRWNSGKTLMDSMEGPVGKFSKFIPDFEIILFDLSAYSDEELKGKAVFKVFY